MKLESYGNFLFFGRKKFKVTDWTPKAPSLLKPEDFLEHNNILQFDGGGIWGIMGVYELYTYEFYNAKNVSKMFSEFWGTSTGSIVAACMAFGMSCKDILQWYIEKGGDVFKPAFMGGGIWGAKYDPLELEKQLKSIFKDLTFLEMYNQTGKELNIQVTNISTMDGELWNYKTTPNNKVWAAIRASCSAPTFFPNFEYNKKEYCDGGTGIYTCLADVAFNSNYFVKKRPVKDFKIFSIGCGLDTIENPDNNKLSQLEFLVKFGRKESTTWQEKFLAYRKQDLGLQYIRWNINTPNNISMDSVDKMDKILELVDHK